MFKLNYLFEEPGDDASKGDLNKEDIITILGEDKEDEPEVLDLKEKKIAKSEEESDDEDSDKEEEKDELDEIEEDLEDPTEEDLELTSPVSRREILTKYPKIFKEFPGLEKAYYRERAYAEVLPTIEDAKEAVNKAQILDQFDADLGKGDLSNALKAVKNTNETAFNKLVDDYLPNLAKVDKDAYTHVVGNVIRTLAIAMVAESKSSGDADLEAAAGILNKFVFRTNKITEPTNLSKPKSETSREQEELDNQRSQLMQERFNVAVSDINTKVNNSLKSTIAAHIDPRQSMTDYVRKNAIRECFETLESKLGSDTRLSVLLDRLWQDSARKNFSTESLNKIKTTYFSVARTLLPTVIKQARNEATKGLGKRVKEDEDDTPKKGPAAVGKSVRSESRSSGKSDRDIAKEIPKGMSTRDYLALD